MGVLTILLIIIFLVILYYIIRRYYYNSNTLVSGINDATSMQTISYSSLNLSSNGTQNFTFSVWIYISDWSYNYGERKIILGKTGNTSGSYSPIISLGLYDNNLKTEFDVFCNPNQSDTCDSTTNTMRQNCTITNVPIQKWVNILVSVYNRTLDIYLNGKLVKTCYLMNIVNFGTSDLYLTPNGGFSGYTAKLQFWPNSTDPQTAWNIYAKGFSNSLFGSNSYDYSLKVSLYNGNNEESSITI